MKQKLVALLLISMMVVSLAACGTEKNSQEDGSGGTQTSQDTKETEDEESSEETADTNAAQTSESNILIAYFSVPEDIDTDGIDADAGASVVVKDGARSEGDGNVDKSGYIRKSIWRAVILKMM